MTDAQLQLLVDAIDKLAAVVNLAGLSLALMLAAIGLLIIWRLRDK